MPTITVNYRDLCELLGKQIELENLRYSLLMLGIESEAAGGELKLEIFHNRPDLLSPEGVARAIKGFLNIERGLPQYRVTPSRITIVVDRSVTRIRPFIAAGVTTGVKLTDDVVSSLMQVQEKLHESLCRKRQRGSIGVYDLDKISPPIRYTSVSPDGIKFVPLEFSRELTPKQILQQHPKGIEYRQIVEKWCRYPLLIDSKGVILSMPPIINSEATRVTSRTKNLFIDVTGEDERTVNQTLTILMTALAERSFKLKSVRVKYPSRQLTTPNLQPCKRIMRLSHANECIGLRLKPKEAAKIVERMRYGVVGVRGDTMTLLVPPYRADLMHEVDLIEDIAVGYGYDRLEPTLPNVMTIGERAPIERLSRRARSVLSGLGFMEAMTYTLTNPTVNFEFMRMRGEAVTISNPVSDEYTIVRTSLLPSLLLVLRANKRHPLPQRVFEVGDVALLDEREETGAKKVRRVAAVVVDDRANLTDIRAVAEALLREFGVSPELRPVEHPSFLEGRAVEFIKGGKSMGIAGELHPEVILNFELEHPVAAFELTCFGGGAR